MKLVDTHCHLCHGRLRGQVADVLDRGREAGVVATVCAVGDVQESRAAAALAGEYPDVFCMAGVHPHAAKEVGPHFLTQLEPLAAHDRNAAIGEIGLDYHYEYSPRADQQRVFAEQLDLAVQLDKLVVVHTREAFGDTMALLDAADVDGSRVVFHSWTGDAAEVRRVLDFGAAVSFSGIVTFQKADDIRQAAAVVPDERLLVETDGPFLSPEPVRKMKTNEPANVAHVAACLARVRGTDAEALARITTENATRLFGLVLP